MKRIYIIPLLLIAGVLIYIAASDYINENPPMQAETQQATDALNRQMEEAIR